MTYRDIQRYNNYVSETISQDCVTVRLFRTSQEGKLIRGFQEAGTVDPGDSKVTRVVWLTKALLESWGSPKLVEVTIRPVKQDGTV
jgi:hypothetical protein